MQYRVSVMYQNSRRVIVFMVLCLICETTATCVIFGIHTRESTCKQPMPIFTKTCPGPDIVYVLVQIALSLSLVSVFA